MVVSVFVVPLTSSSLDGVDFRQQSGLCVELDYYVLHDTVKGTSLDFERSTEDQQEKKKQPACFFATEGHAREFGRSVLHYRVLLWTASRTRVKCIVVQRNPVEHNVSLNRRRSHFGAWARHVAQKQKAKPPPFTRLLQHTPTTTTNHRQSQQQQRRCGSHYSASEHPIRRPDDGGEQTLRCRSLYPLHPLHPRVDGRRRITAPTAYTTRD